MSECRIEEYSCLACRFCHGGYECRRFPPQVNIEGDGNAVTMFPQITAEESCGEFKPKIPKLDLDAINARQTRPPI